MRNSNKAYYVALKWKNLQDLRDFVSYNLRMVLPSALEGEAASNTDISKSV